MPQFITDEVLTGCMEMIREKLYHRQDEMDTTYDRSKDGDQDDGKPPNRSISVAINLNFTNKKEKVKVTNSLTFVTDKVHDKDSRIFDPDQQVLPFEKGTQAE